MIITIQAHNNKYLFINDLLSSLVPQLADYDYGSLV